MKQEGNKKALSLKTLTKSNVWDIQENDIFRMLDGIEKDVEAKVTMVHPTEIEELYAAILISVYDDGCPAMRGIVTK